MILVAELSTNHGGDVGLAAEMIQAAAESGATYAKFQTYSLDRLNPTDPQANWLRQAHLDRAAHERLMTVAQEAGIRFLSTPFDADSLKMLRKLGLKSFKIASSESASRWWTPDPGEWWCVSLPWGKGRVAGVVNMTAIPLYPTPLECVGQSILREGWSDHGETLDACYCALARGASVLEVHLSIGKGRTSVWDKTPDQVRELRRFASSMETIKTGVATRFRERWQHGA